MRPLTTREGIKAPQMLLVQTHGLWDRCVLRDLRRLSNNV
jgi:hypothetical protein